MSKIGISIKLDVKKLDKARFFAAQSGALYVDLTMFLDPDNEGQYGDHGFITQSTTKEEREQNVQMPILGNGKIFYGLQELKGSGQAAQPQGGWQGVRNDQQQGQQQGGGFTQQPSQQLAQKRQNQQANGFAQQTQQKVNPQEPDMNFDDDIPF